jgi:hypothetical protein
MGEHLQQGIKCFHDWKHFFVKQIVQVYGVCTQIFTVSECSMRQSVRPSRPMFSYLQPLANVQQFLSKATATHTAQPIEGHAP